MLISCIDVCLCCMCVAESLHVTEAKLGPYLGQGLVVIRKMLNFVLCYARSNATVNLVIQLSHGLAGQP